MSNRAKRDLIGIGPGPALDQIEGALRSLGLSPPPRNLEIKALKGHKPWLRLRVGDWRALYRPLTADELGRVGEVRHLEGEKGDLVERVVNRRDLERAVAKLL